MWLLAGGAGAAGQAEKPKATWTELPFAIVRLNEQPPFSWNIYHSPKKGQLLVRLWKRYLLVNLQDEEAFDIDPQTITVRGNTALLSPSDIPDKPIDAQEWKDRNVGAVKRILFRFGKDGHFLELQIPLGPGGREIY